MSSSARNALLFSIKKTLPRQTFSCAGTNLLWFGDNNNSELKIIGGKTKQTTHFLVDTLKEVLFL